MRSDKIEGMGTNAVHLTPIECKVIRTFRRRWRIVQTTGIILIILFFVAGPGFGPTHNPAADERQAMRFVFIVLMVIAWLVFLFFVFRCPACNQAPGSGVFGLPTLGSSVRRCGNCGALLDWPRISKQFTTPGSVAREFRRRMRLFRGLLAAPLFVAIPVVVVMFTLRPRPSDEIVFFTIFGLIVIWIALGFGLLFALYRCPRCGDWPAAGGHTLDGELAFRLDVDSCQSCGASLMESTQLS